MKKNKKYFIIGGVLLLVIIGLLAVLSYFNNGGKDFSFQERNWINSNSNNVIDVGLQNGLPIFSDNGEGVFYDFINSFEKNTHLTLNININSSGNYIFQNKNDITQNDLVLFNDHYVIISTVNNDLFSLNDIKDNIIGVIEEDLDYVSKYLNNYNLQYKKYSKISELSDDMDNSIIYAVVPMNKYMNEIQFNKYNIIYHIEGLHSHYVLSMNDSKSVLSNVFKKFLNTWNREQLRDSINKHFFSLYTEAYSLRELELDSIKGDDLLVGYINNMPIEGKINYDFSGFANAYLELFGNLTGATYKYIEYSSVEELNKALNDKKIDIVFNYNNITNTNYTLSETLGNINYSIVSYKNCFKSLNDLSSIKGDTIKMVKNNNLYNYINSMGVNIDGFDNYDELLKSINDDDILIIDKIAYDYYKNNELDGFIERTIGETNNSYSFLLNNDNTILNKIFNFYITSLGINEVNNMAINTSINDSSLNIVVDFILKNISYILALLLAVGFLVLKFNKKIKISKKIKKEDRMMYLDVMTNLKNRNYLNDNLKYWEANKVYPQAVIVIDLNSIAVINDNKGHEEGDKQIKTCASVLIKTQRENSEIIRTDGNEFLVYLVGYDERQIVTYVNKLTKEFKTLPYEYGAALGYYMINSESTSIDDAINEALIMMKNNKGV